MVNCASSKLRTPHWQIHLFATIDQYERPVTTRQKHYIPIYVHMFPLISQLIFHTFPIDFPHTSHRFPIFPTFPSPIPFHLQYLSLAKTLSTSWIWQVPVCLGRALGRRAPRDSR